VFIDKVEGIIDSNSLYAEGRRKLRRAKIPIQYELEPESIASGSNWNDLIPKNLNDERLTNIDVRLHSMDTYNLVVSNMSKFIYLMEPEEEVRLEYRVSAFSCS
jgi:hypothetical protein